MAHNVAYKRRRLISTTSPSLYTQESRHSIYNNSYMTEPQPCNPYKRLRPEQCLPQESLQPLSKRQKLNHPRASQPPPPAFWDNLSKIWLTERALKELDRRNTQSSLSLPHRRTRRPITRHIVAEWKNKVENWEPTQSATDFLARCSTRHLERIKLLARHGGPNLSDLRGVCVFQYLLEFVLIIFSLVPEPY